MITEIVGKSGCGKTLLAVKYAQDALAEGKSVWANIRIEGCQRFDYWADVPKDAGMAIMDEADVWWYRNPASSILDMMMHMQDVHLVVTCQHHHVFSPGRADVIKPSMDKMELIVRTRFDARPLFSMYDTSETESAR